MVYTIIRVDSYSVLGLRLALFYVYKMGLLKQVHFYFALKKHWYHRPAPLWCGAVFLYIQKGEPKQSADFFKTTN